MNQAKSILKTAIGLPLTIIAFVFIAKVFYDSWPSISELVSQADVVLVLLGTGFFILFFLIRGFAWTRILRLYGTPEKTTPTGVFHFLLAETKRYIPGNVFSFIARVDTFKAGLSKKDVVKALILEGFLATAAATLTSLPALINQADRLPIPAPLPIILALLAIFGVIVFFLRDKLHLHQIIPARTTTHVDLLIIYTVSWILFGIGNYLVATALVPLSPSLFLIFVSAFVAAWLIGFLSFITPMGLGVREAAIIFFLSPILPVAVATTIAVFTRMALILGEIGTVLLSFLLARFQAPLRRRLPTPSLIMVSAMGFFFMAYFIFFTVVRHLKFYSGKFDLGNMDQTVWNTIHGRIFTFVDPDGVVETLRLSAHADFILILFAPFYWLYESPITLLVIQTLIIALGGYFIYLITLHVLSSQRMAVILTLGYYLNYFVQEQTVFDFHAVSLATTFLLGAFYFLLANRYRWFIVMLALAVLTKENVYLVAALFGILLWRKNYRWQGVVLFTCGIFIFLLLMAYLIPAARTGDDHFALSYLSYLGNSPVEILLSPILKPALFFGRLFSVETLEYIRMTLLPVGFISLFAPFYLIFLLPDFLINIMSSNENLRSIQYHYGALLIPFVYISAIYGIKTIQRFSPRPRTTLALLSYYLLAMILYSTYLYGLLPGTRRPDLAVFQPIPHKEEIHASLASIPPDASVAASNSLAAHLSHRRFIYVLPLGIDQAEYVAVYKTHLSLAEDLATYESTHVVVERIGSDYVLLKRISRNGPAVSL